MKYYQQYGVLQMISQDILDCSKNKLDVEVLHINIKECLIFKGNF